MNFEFKLGNDNGNSTHNIIIDGYKIEQPNVYSKVRNLPMLDEINPDFVAENIEDNLITIINSEKVTPGIYLIGNYALKSGERVRAIEVGADNNKIESKVVIINTLSQIAGHAAAKAYKKDKSIERVTAKVNMTTALPINQYNKKNAEEFENVFYGKHDLTVMLGSKRINVEIEFDFIKVLPEGVTTVHAIQNIDNEIFKDFNSKYNLNVDKDYFRNKKILHIAIGEGTTEYPVTNDIMFEANFIKGSNNGIGHAIDKSLDEFKNELGLLNYSRQKYSEVLKDEGHKYHVIAKDIIEDYIDEEAEEILHIAKNEVERANNEVDIIMVYGGGSIPMRDILERKLNSICERADIKLFYIPSEYAVILESLGMYNFTIGKIFEVLKSRAKQ